MPEPMVVRPVVLQDERVRLEPLTEAHVEPLLASMEADTFRYMFTCPAALTHQAVHSYVSVVSSRADQVAFAVIDRATGRVAGSTSYLAIRPYHRGVEIGCTWIHSSWRGSGVNAGMKRLMLTHAFDELGALRVELHADELNTRSRRAIEKLGARLEGLFRSHMIMADGRVRNTVIYGITRDDWAAVKAGLQPTP